MARVLKRTKTDSNTDERRTVAFAEIGCLDQQHSRLVKMIREKKLN